MPLSYKEALTEISRQAIRVSELEHEHEEDVREIRRLVEKNVRLGIELEIARTDPATSPGRCASPGGGPSAGCAGCGGGDRHDRPKE